MSTLQNAEADFLDFLRAAPAALGITDEGISVNVHVAGDYRRVSIARWLPGKCVEQVGKGQTLAEAAADYAANTPLAVCVRKLGKAVRELEEATANEATRTVNTGIPQ
jgi:hypothetical protein